ncbi:hypothetical protein AB0L06_01085 [Spirillospora sp. NPDC052269]
MSAKRCRTALAWTTLGVAVSLVGVRPALAETSPPTDAGGSSTASSTTRVYDARHVNGALSVHGVVYVDWRPDFVEPDATDRTRDVRCAPGELSVPSGVAAHLPNGGKGPVCVDIDVSVPWRGRPVYKCGTVSINGQSRPIDGTAGGHCNLNGSLFDRKTGRFTVVSPYSARGPR